MRFEDLGTILYRVMLATAVLRLRSTSDAEDVCQNVFADALPRWDQIEDPAAYLWRSLFNGCQKVGRKRGRRLRAIRRLGEPRSVDQVLDTRIHAVQLLQHLEPRQQEVLLLRHFVGMTEPEVANALGIPIGTVKSIAHRAIRALRQLEERPTDGDR